MKQRRKTPASKRSDKQTIDARLGVSLRSESAGRGRKKMRRSFAVVLLLATTAMVLFGIFMR